MTAEKVVCMRVCANNEGKNLTFCSICGKLIPFHKNQEYGCAAEAAAVSRKVYKIRFSGKGI